MIKVNDLSGSDLFARFRDEKIETVSKLAVVMARVSIKKNKDKGNSDEAQLDRIGQYIVENDFELACDAWDVAETASKHERRRHFREMLRTVLESQSQPVPIKHIVFSHQSRSNRNRESAREIEDLIRKYGISLHCVRDSLILHKNSPFEDWLKWDIFNNLNEKFIKDHTANVMDGVRKRVELGLFPGKAPFGYRNYRENEKSTSYFIIHEREAQCVRAAFDLFSQGGVTVKELARVLRQRFPDFEGRLNDKRLAEVLRNVFYNGRFLYMGRLFNGNPSYHPVLVEDSLFQKVQSVLEDGVPRRSHKLEMPYVGLIRCGGMVIDDLGIETDVPCGCAVTGEAITRQLARGGTAQYVYYRCSNTSFRCSQRSVVYMKRYRERVSFSQAQVEKLFAGIVEPIQIAHEEAQWLSRHLRSSEQDQQKNWVNEKAHLEKAAAKLRGRIHKAYEDKIDGALSEGEWREFDLSWRRELVQVQTRIDSMTPSEGQELPTVSQLIEMAQSLNSSYEKASPALKRTLIEIISSNRILKDGTLRFDYRKPFDLLAKNGEIRNWWT